MLEILSAEQVKAVAAIPDNDSQNAAFIAHAERVCAMPIPIDRPPLAEVVDDYKNLGYLRGLDIIDTHQPWTAKHNEPTGVKLGAIARMNVGSTASDAWQIHERMRARFIFDPSPHFRWQDKWHIATLLRMKTIANPGKPIKMSDVQAAWYRMGYTPGQFRPSVAKAIIAYAGAKVVIDPCAGWGDRMVAAMSAKVEYHGMDTNRGLHWGYRMAHKNLEPSAAVHMSCVDCTTDAAWNGRPAADLVLTSPPHAHYEQYPDGKTLRKHPSAWGELFMRPLLARATHALKPGGLLAIHMCDVKVRSNILPLGRILCDEASQVGGLKLRGSIGIISRDRHGGVIGEPIFIWEKNHA